MISWLRDAMTPGGGKRRGKRGGIEASSSAGPSLAHDPAAGTASPSAQLAKGQSTTKDLTTPSNGANLKTPPTAKMTSPRSKARLSTGDVGGKNDGTATSSSKENNNTSAMVQLWQTLDRQLRVNIGTSVKCGICLSTMTNPVRTPCVHSFCEDCILASLLCSNSCPECKSKLSKRQLQPFEYLQDMACAYKDLLKEFGFAPGRYDVNFTTLTQKAGSADTDAADDDAAGRMDRLCVAQTWKQQALPYCQEVSKLQIQENEHVVAANLDACVDSDQPAGGCWGDVKVGNASGGGRPKSAPVFRTKMDQMTPLQSTQDVQEQAREQLAADRDMDDSSIEDENKQDDTKKGDDLPCNPASRRVDRNKEGDRSGQAAPESDSQQTKSSTSRVTFTDASPSTDLLSSSPSIPSFAQSKPARRAIKGRTYSKRIYRSKSEEEIEEELSMSQSTSNVMERSNNSVEEKYSESQSSVNGDGESALSQANDDVHMEDREAQNSNDELAIPQKQDPAAEVGNDTGASSETATSIAESDHFNKTEDGPAGNELDNKETSPDVAMEDSSQSNEMATNESGRQDGQPSPNPAVNIEEAKEIEGIETFDEMDGLTQVDRSQRRNGSKAAKSGPTPDSIQVGTIVEVEARTWPGVNKHGGVGRVTSVNEDGTFNIAYVLGGKESHVESTFVSKAEEIVSSESKSEGKPFGRRRRSRPVDELPGDLLRQLAAEGFDVGTSAPPKKRNRLSDSTNQQRSNSRQKSGASTTGNRGKKQRRDTTSMEKPAEATAAPPSAAHTTLPSVGNPGTMDDSPEELAIASAKIDQDMVSSLRPSENNSQNSNMPNEEAIELANKLYQARFQQAMNDRLIVVAASGLDQSENLLLQSLCSKSFQDDIKMEMTDVVDSKTTLCVIPSQRGESDDFQASIRSFKAMKASIEGIPMTTPVWLYQCDQSGQISCPLDFIRSLPTKSEMIQESGDFKYGVARSAAMLWKGLTGLPFRDHFVFLLGCQRNTRKTLTRLLRAGGAGMLSHASEVSSKLKELSEEVAPAPKVVIILGDNVRAWPKRQLENITDMELSSHKEQSIASVVSHKWIAESIACAKPLPVEQFHPKKMA